MKPKPFSIRQRILLFETLALLLTLWVLAMSIFLGWQFQDAPRLPYAILIGTGLMALALLSLSRRMLQRNLWVPVAHLGQMVRQVRRGNLHVRAEIPHSVELGPLVDSFVLMAEELQQVKDRLEEKVKRQSVELDSAQRKLIEAAKLAALGQLVGGVAHEVNNPLTSILGFAEVLLGNPELDAASRRQLQIIRDEALRLRNVVANLSSFGRRAPQHRSRINLHKVLERVVELRRYQLAAAGIQLHWEPPEEPVWVDADADQILQVLFNLLLNAEQAIAASGAKGEIALRCQRKLGEVVLQVSDNGIGISGEVRERIFEPYFTTKSVGQGSGLGLSISQGIVEQHGGRIRVETVPGEGSVFTVFLPEAAPPVAAAAPVETPAARPAEARRLLVIDDEPDITELIHSALRKRGWHVTALNDPLQLETALREAEFDVVLCDLKMPGRNGLEVRAALEGLRPALARCFLLMTGNLADAGAEALSLSSFTLLRKPFTLAQLNEALRMLEFQKDHRSRPANATAEPG